jgi:2-polyprenyl-6-methoxyphenol hydroxylase-like FAD-dependent oxidoreductase
MPGTSETAAITPSHNVLIVGAGPVGLFLACELALAGCSVLVLESESAPDSPVKAYPLGMRGLSTGAVEAFYRRGILSSLLTASNADPAPDLDDDQIPPRTAGHFAGIMMDSAKIAASSLPYQLPGPAGQGLITNLQAIEVTLSERAATLGVTIERGDAVSAVSQDDDMVVAHAGERKYAARWLVGCDGGRSAVRKLAGFEFVGTEPEFTGYTVVVTLDDPGKLRPGFNLTPTGMYLRTPFPGHLGLHDFDGGAFDRSQRPSREHLQEILRRVSGTDVTINEVELVSTYTDRSRQATTYRRGRVLLAGDAAHIHSPLGAQGLTAGIGDALNLGWKLAATVRGNTDDDLLDTYTRERHPIGAWVLDWTRAQVAIQKPDFHGQAIQRLVRDLLDTTDGTTYMFEKMSGLNTRYDLGNEHPLVGRTVPDFRIEGGGRLGDLMHDGRGIVLDSDPSQPLAELARAWEGRIRYVASSLKNRLAVEGVLVRPDGVVAWINDGGPNVDAFTEAATRWFGEPKG